MDCQPHNETSVGACVDSSDRSESVGLAEHIPYCSLSLESLAASVASLTVVQQPVAAIMAANPSANVADVARQVVLSLVLYDDTEVHPMSWNMDGVGRPTESSSSTTHLYDTSAQIHNDPAIVASNQVLPSLCVARCVQVPTFAKTLGHNVRPAGASRDNISMGVTCNA